MPRYLVYQTHKRIGPREPPPSFPENYRHVANVEAKSLEHAYHLAHSPEQSWMNNKGVEVFKPSRPIGIGDVMVDPEMKVHRVEKEGYTQIGRISLGQPAADKTLAAEFRAEEHFARVQAYGEADAATYPERVRQGAASASHLPPETRNPSPQELDQAVTRLESEWRSGQLGKAAQTDHAHFDSVITRIDELRGETFDCHPERSPRPSQGADDDTHHRDMVSTSTGWDSWSGLNNAERRAVLEQNVDWDGFTDGQRDKVIDSVIANKPKDQWVEGVQSQNAYDPGGFARPGSTSDPSKGRSR